MRVMTTFSEHQHPRTGNGRFTAKDHSEAQLELAAPIVTLSEATGDWGPRFHDMDFRPAYDYVPTERAAAAFRTQFGAAPEAEVDGEYCFESPNRPVLKIWAAGRVAVNFPGPTRQVAEANMLAALDRMAGDDAPWRRADPLDAESFDEIFYEDGYKNHERQRFLGASRSIEDAEEGYQHELSRLHRSLAERETPTPVDLDAAVRSSYAELVEDFAAGTQAGRIVRDPQLPQSTRSPVVGNLMGRCYAAAQVLNRNEDPKTTALTAAVLKGAVQAGRPWNQVLQRMAMDVGEHRRGPARG